MVLGVRWTVMMVALMGLFNPARAQSPPNKFVTCSEAEARHAEKEAVTLRTWDALYHSYQAYRQCDDGSVGESYSESVGRILVDHWQTLPSLDEIDSRDVSFQRFVIRHVDATLDLGNLKRIFQNANTRCPAAWKGICGELAKRADDAIREDAALGIH
jgi:hypothetical protein